jgi:hypothetical protein
MPVSHTNHVNGLSLHAAAGCLFYPCRCLCRGLFLHMIYTRPFLFTLRQNTHRLRTAELTFIPRICCCCCATGRRVAEETIGRDRTALKDRTGRVSVVRKQDRRNIATGISMTHTPWEGSQSVSSAFYSVNENWHSKSKSRVANRVFMLLRRGGTERSIW